MKIVRSILAVLFSCAQMTQAQTVTTTVETTKITSEASTPESLEQLVTSIRAYDGLVINFEGELLWNSISEDEWLLIVDDGLAITLELDDGRATTQQAQKCPSKFTNAGSGCKVQVDVELQTASSHRLYDAHISIKGVGFNVKFLE